MNLYAYVVTVATTATSKVIVLGAADNDADAHALLGIAEATYAKATHTFAITRCKLWNTTTQASTVPANSLLTGLVN